jgi:hypothetical protein
VYPSSSRRGIRLRTTRAPRLPGSMGDHPDPSLSLKSSLAGLRARLKARQFVPHRCGSTPCFAAIDLVSVGPGHQPSLAELLAFLAGQAIVATTGVGVLPAGPVTQGLGGDAEILGL